MSYFLIKQCRTEFRTDDVFHKCDLANFCLFKYRFYFEAVKLLNEVDSFISLCSFII